MKDAFVGGARTLEEVFDYHGKAAICAGCLIDINWLLGKLAEAKAGARAKPDSEPETGSSG